MTLHLVLPDGVDDLRRPSGGNVYDRRLAAALEARGVEVREHPVGAAGLGSVLAGLPDAALVLVDGLVASTTEVLVAESRRLRVAVLLHMPESGPAEPAVLAAVAAVVTTSAWARGWVIDRLRIPPERVHVARPGVEPGPVVTGSARGANLLCVGPLTPAKGYDDLLGALADLADLDWHCRCAGALDLLPSYTDDFRARVRELGLDGRIELLGPLPPAALEELRSASDLVVAPSRRESYGMALAEGLARGLPAIVTDVGGHAEALGAGGDGVVPGALVPAGAPAALAEVLRGWLGDPGLRERWRDAAAQRRRSLGTWEATAAEAIRVLNLVAPDVVRTGETRR